MESEFSGDMHICTLCPKYITCLNKQINRYKKIKKTDKSKKLIQMFFFFKY